MAKFKRRLNSYVPKLVMVEEGLVLLLRYREKGIPTLAESTPIYIS
jgi:hypothetical protein